MLNKEEVDESKRKKANSHLPFKFSKKTQKKQKIKMEELKLISEKVFKPKKTAFKFNNVVFEVK